LALIRNDSHSWIENVDSRVHHAKASMKLRSHAWTLQEARSDQRLFRLYPRKADVARHLWEIRLLSLISFLDSTPWVLFECYSPLHQSAANPNYLYCFVRPSRQDVRIAGGHLVTQFSVFSRMSCLTLAMFIFVLTSNSNSMLLFGRFSDCCHWVTAAVLTDDRKSCLFDKSGVQVDPARETDLE